MKDKTKRRLVTIGYLLWALAFLPTALLVEGIMGLPHFLDAYVFHWENATMAFVSFCFYFLITLSGVPILCFLSSEIRNDSSSTIVYLWMISIIGLFSDLVFAYLDMCQVLLPLPHAFYWVFSLTFIIVCVFIVLFIGRAKREYRDSVVDWCVYPEDKKALIRIALAQDHYGSKTCEDALSKLPYMYERDTIARVALNGHHHVTRAKALGMLRYPDDRDTIARVALDDDTDYICAKALGMLRYPDDREAIAAAALGGGSASVRATALDMLRYPQEREVLRQCAVSDSDLSNKLATVRRLSPQTDKDTYLCVIDECESRVRGVHQYEEFDSDVKKAADGLNELYRKIGSSKSVSHFHDTKSVNHNDHTDSHDGYVEGCNGQGFNDYVDEHTDININTCTVHDDYYIINEG